MIVDMIQKKIISNKIVNLDDLSNFVFTFNVENKSLLIDNEQNDYDTNLNIINSHINDNKCYFRIYKKRKLRKCFIPKIKYLIKNKINYNHVNKLKIDINYHFSQKDIIVHDNDKIYVIPYIIKDVNIFKDPDKNKDYDYPFKL